MTTALQQPSYANAKQAERARQELAKRPPLVSPKDTRRLHDKLAAVAAGKAFLLQAGDCAEMFDTPRETHANLIRLILQMAMILANGGEIPVIKTVRGAGQYGKPRSSDTDGHGLPSYRGDLINGFEPTPAARVHDPARLLRAYGAAAKTLRHIHDLTTGGLGDLRRIHDWTLDFVQTSPQSEVYARVAQEVTHALRLVEALGFEVTSTDNAAVADVWTCHEGLVLDYERPLTHDGYATSGHFLWVGERTRHLDHAHIEYFRGINNPIGVKIGPGVSPDEILAYCRILNPHHTPGRLTFISRVGWKQVDLVLPRLMRASQETGCPVIWICDPMHGNTFAVENGLKTRRIGDILDEISGFFRACTETGVHPGGVHLEVTGDDVTECLGGHDRITPLNLSRGYTSACDPRLNGRQSLEVAFFVAELLRNHPT